MMSDFSNELNQCAKLAEQAERCDGIAAAVRKLAESAKGDLSQEERGLFCAAFEAVVNPRLQSFRILSSIEQIVRGNAEKQPMAREHRLKVQQEIMEICGNILDTLDKLLSHAGCAKSFYSSMKIVYSQHLAELTQGEDQMACQEFAELADIFKRMSAYQRQRYFADFCQSLRRDRLFTRVNLSDVPGRHIGVFVSHCPNLESVFAADKTFALNELHILSQRSLSSVVFHRCTVVLPATGDAVADPLSAALGGLRGANWEELVLNRFSVKLHPVGVAAGGGQVTFPASFPASLKRLQVSGVQQANDNGRSYYDWTPYLGGFDGLEQLECLILTRNFSDSRAWSGLLESNRLSNLAQSLRELFVSDQKGKNLGRNLLQLDKLEVLLIQRCSSSSDDFYDLATKHPSLRILVLTGTRFAGRYFDFPVPGHTDNGSGAAALPRLHICVGPYRHAEELPFSPPTDQICLPFSPPADVRFHLFREPLPAFLDRVDIKPIFEGVWIAEKIRESAERVVELARRTSR